MDSADLAELYGRVKRRLRAELGEEVYSSWFSSATCEDVNGGVVLISVATRFLKSWIENHYSKRMLELFKEEHPSLWRIELRVRQARRRMAVSGNGTTIEHDAAQARSASHPATEAVSPPNGEPTLPSPTRMAAAFHDDTPHSSPLDPRMTMDNFVTGPGNRFAHGAALEIIANRQASFCNPLFVHGGVGLGKTHLLQATAASVRVAGRKVLYVTAERFMFGFVTALKTRSAMAFKEALQGVDVLVVDDVQFLQGKTIIPEFCNILNSLLNEGKIVIAAADRPPVDLENLDDRARSRLSGGLAVEIAGMEFETRRAILERRARALSPQAQDKGLPEGVLDQIARLVDTNGRDLEGAFNQVYAKSRYAGQTLSGDAVEDALKALLRPREPRKVKIEEIQTVVARHYNISRQDLLSSRRTRTIVRPRQIAMYLAKLMTLRSLPEIGRRFGGRDHTTVLHAVRKIESILEDEPNLRTDIDKIRKELETDQ